MIRSELKSFRSSARSLTVLLLVATMACASDLTAPSASAQRMKDPKPKKKDPISSVTPAFLFVSTVSGAPQIYRFSNDSVARLSFSDMPDVNPHVAGGSAVFASYRDGDGEIYFGDAELKSVKRLTQSVGMDDEPSLSPLGDRIAFVSARSGTSRIYMMDTTGGAQIALETGSTSSTPETRPAWNPAGDRIAFASSRGGAASQIYIVSSGGGSATRLTSESVGAFDPVFSADGTQIIYTAWLSSARLRVITLATGAITDHALVNSLSTGEATCGAAGCIATENPYGDSGDIVHIATDGARRVIVGRTGNDYRPALLQR